MSQAVFSRPNQRAPRAQPDPHREFDQAVVQFREQLRGFFRRRVRDQATADDLLQETLLKVYRSRATLLEGHRLEAWIYRIARRTLIDHWRRVRPNDELPENLAAEAEDDVNEITAVLGESLKRFLEELPEHYREPVRLADFTGLPLAKIALRLELSLTAVKSRVQRGRLLLKKKLQACCRMEFDGKGRVIGCERRKKEPCQECA